MYLDLLSTTLATVLDSSESIRHLMGDSYTIKSRVLIELREGREGIHPLTACEEQRQDSHAGLLGFTSHRTCAVNVHWQNPRPELGPWPAPYLAQCSPALVPALECLH